MSGEPGPIRGTIAVGLVTAVIVFTGLVGLDAFDIAPHSAIRAGVVGFVASIGAHFLVKLLKPNWFDRH